MKVSIATPCYDGKLESIYVDGLVQSFMAGMVNNYLRVTTESLVPRARNRLAYEFLQTGDDFLVFIDADIGWTVDHLRRLLSHGKDVIGGCYPKKVEGGGYVFNDVIREDGDLVEVRETGTGFLAIKRSVIEGLGVVAKSIKMDSGTEYLECFPVGPDKNGHYLSEDYGFCALVRKLGIPVWVDRGIRLKHVGRKVYT